MSLKKIIGSLLMHATDAIALPAEPTKTDPFNFAMDQRLQRPRRAAAELLASLQGAFPSLPHAEAQAIMQQIDLLQNEAGEAASQVNRRLLSEAAAKAQLKQAFPQIDQGNLASVMMQNLIDTR